jgi:hypothetical protein
MRYRADASEIHAGDHVLVEGDVPGVVVCDFDNWQAIAGYEGWLTKEELVGGGKLSSGIMVETKDLGMVHYPSEDDRIVRA